MDRCVLLRAEYQHILRTAERCGALNLRVFGSVVRGNDRAHSDVDLLVDMDRDRSLLDIVACVGISKSCSTAELTC